MMTISKRKGLEISGKVVMYIFLISLLIFTLYPILYIVLGSFKSNQELVLGGTKLIPNEFIMDNYVQAWKLGNFSKYTFNSIYLSFFVMAGVLIVSSMAGYCFARREFFGKNFLFSALLAFMFINIGSVALRPLFELAVKVNLHQSLWGVIFISVGTNQATNIFLVKGYMNTIPRELDDAAAIDGCGFFSTYFLIILPVLKPVLATIALLSFRSAWNEYIIPSIFTMTRPDLKPLTVGVVSLRYMQDGAAAWNIMFAGSTMSIVPIVILYLFTSKFFVSGLMSGSLKG